MKTWFCLVLLGCGGTQPSGDDVVVGDDAPPSALSTLERCALDGKPLHEVFSVGNQHGPVSSIVGGALIVLGSDDGSVKQWTVDGDEPNYGKPFTTAGAPVKALAFSSDQHILAANTNGEIAEWKLVDATAARTNTIADIMPTAIAVSDDAARVMVGTLTGQTFAVDRATGATTQLQSTLWGVDAVAFGKTNRLLTAGHFYSTPMIERRAADAPTTVVDSWNDKERTGHVRALAFDGEATTIAAAGDHFIAVFASDQLAAGPVAIREAGEHMAVGATMLPGGALFATAGAEGTVKLWKTASAELVTTLQIPTPIGIASDSAGTRLYTSGPDGRLHAFGCD